MTGVVDQGAMEVYARVQADRAAGGPARLLRRSLCRPGSAVRTRTPTAGNSGDTLLNSNDVHHPIGAGCKVCVLPLYPPGLTGPSRATQSLSKIVFVALDGPRKVGHDTLGHSKGLASPRSCRNVRSAKR